MKVRVVVYLEAAETSLVWCAESPDVPGFYAADDDLQGLLVRVEQALIDALAEDQGEDIVESLNIDWRLVGTPASEGLEITADVDDPPVGHATGSVVTTSRRPVVAA